MEDNRQKWIDDVLGSSQGMERARPSANLYQQVMAALDKPLSVSRPFPVRQWAAAAILLIMLNVGSFIYYTTHNHSNLTTAESTTVTSTGNPMVEDMQLENTYNY